MPDYTIDVVVNGEAVKTLADILPDEPGLKVLFVAKTPAPKSVAAGHYFQGSQGTAFWNRLREYEILDAPLGHHEDDHLLKNGFGITDIVKVPRDYGNEPSKDEYKAGTTRILEVIRAHSPLVTVFVYKKVLDQLLANGFRRREKSVYGFNPALDSLFGSRVFVFPMPGTPCRSEDAHAAMLELAASLSEAKKSA